jgi:hypothetical protein
MVKSDNGHIEADPMPPELKDFISSPAMRSITRSLNPLYIEFKNANKMA